MNLYPRSLRGRLALLLIGVLLLAQLSSAALHLKDRGKALLLATGFDSAQRISGLVKVLDPMTQTQRNRVVEALDMPPLRLTLAEAPISLPDDQHNSARARLFHRILHFNLGQDRPIMVTLQDDGSSPLPTPTIGVDERLSGMAKMHAIMVQRHGPGSPLSSSLNFIAQVQLQDGQWVQFAYYLPKELADWPWDLFVGLLILLTSVLLVSFYAIRWITRPLSTLATAAADLGKDIEHAPLAETGPTEVRHAARAFNTMQRRLSRFVKERTRILAAVSHDLKTPITRMRLRLEDIENPGLRDKFDSDLGDMQTLVQSSLDFMRGIAIKEETRPLDINSLLDSLAEDALEMGHTVTLHGEATMPYQGKPLALKRCLGNLIDNAIQYGHSAEIRIQDSEDNLVIIISDRGPGLPESALEQVFEPFVRMEPSRNTKTGGTGLGLSIARNIARAHGGELWLEIARDGGLDAWLRLPR